MAISVVNIGTGQNVAGGANFSIASIVGGIPAGSLVCMAVAELTSSSTAGTVTDTPANTYSFIVPKANGSTIYSRLFYAFNSTTISSTGTISYTKIAAANNAIGSAFYATGIQTSSDPHDSSVDATATSSTTAPTVTSGSASVSGNLDVAFAAINVAGNTFTQDVTHGWATPPSTITGNGPASPTLGGGNQVNAGTSAKTFAPAWTTGAALGTIQVTAFKAVAAATSSTVPLRMRMGVGI